MPQMQPAKCVGRIEERGVASVTSMLRCEHGRRESPAASAASRWHSSSSSTARRVHTAQWPKQAADDAALDPSAPATEAERREQVDHDVVVVAR